MEYVWKRILETGPGNRILGPGMKQSGHFLFDSHAAIRTLASYEVKLNIVWHCLQKLNQFGRQNKVALCWHPEQENKRACKQGTCLMKPESFCRVGAIVSKVMLIKKKIKRGKNILQVRKTTLNYGP